MINNIEMGEKKRFGFALRDTDYKKNTNVKSLDL
jgi:hypothetical protein